MKSSRASIRTSYIMPITEKNATPRFPLRTFKILGYNTPAQRKTQRILDPCVILVCRLLLPIQQEYTLSYQSTQGYVTTVLNLLGIRE
jgi:hypothetical protein